MPPWPSRNVRFGLCPTGRTGWGLATTSWHPSPCEHLGLATNPSRNPPHLGLATYLFSHHTCVFPGNHGPRTKMASLKKMEREIKALRIQLQQMAARDGCMWLPCVNAKCSDGRLVKIEGCVDRSPQACNMCSRCYRCNDRPATCSTNCDRRTCGVHQHACSCDICTGSF